MRPFMKLLGTLMVAVTASLGQSTSSSTQASSSQTPAVPVIPSLGQNATSSTQLQPATNQSARQTTVANATGTSSAEMIRCYVCTSANSTSPCATAPSIDSLELCGEGEVCQVRKYSGKGSFYNVTRGCVEQSFCDKTMTSFGGRSCMTNSNANLEECLYCCSSDRCNAAQMLTATPMFSALLLFWAAWMFISIFHSVTFWPCLL